MNNEEKKDFCNNAEKLYVLESQLTGGCKIDDIIIFQEDKNKAQRLKRMAHKSKEDVVNFLCVLF